MRDSDLNVVCRTEEVSKHWVRFGIDTLMTGLVRKGFLLPCCLEMRY